MHVHVHVMHYVYVVHCVLHYVVHYALCGALCSMWCAVWCAVWCTEDAKGSLEEVRLTEDARLHGGRHELDQVDLAALVDVDAAPDLRQVGRHLEPLQPQRHGNVCGSQLAATSLVGGAEGEDLCAHAVVVLRAEHVGLDEHH